MKVGIFSALALTAAATALISLPAFADLDDRSSTDIALASVELEVNSASSIAMAAYDRLSTGMSYEEVEAEVGRTGWEVGRIEVPDGSTTVVYRWFNRNGATMSATFQDGELIAKTQYGLR